MTQKVYGMPLHGKGQKSNYVLGASYVTLYIQ